MSRKEPKRSGKSDQNKAIARWDNEGGAPKGAPQEDRNELAPLTNEEEHILRCSVLQSSCNGTIFPQKSSANFLNMRVPWVS
jgi:hypothetical protein